MVIPSLTILEQVEVVEEMKVEAEQEVPKLIVTRKKTRMILLEVEVPEVEQEVEIIVSSVQKRTTSVYQPGQASAGRHEESCGWLAPGRKTLETSGHSRLDS